MMRRVLAGCGSALPKSPSEDGYVGGRSRSFNGLRPHDLVELLPVPAATIVISPRFTPAALVGAWPAAVAPCPSLPLKTVTLVVGPGAATASVERAPPASARRRRHREQLRALDALWHRRAASSLVSSTASVEMAPDAGTVSG